MLGILNRLEEDKLSTIYTPVVNQRVLIPHVQDNHFYAIVMDISESKFTVAVHDSLQTQVNVEDLRADDPRKIKNMSVWVALKMYIKKMEACRDITVFQHIPTLNAMQPDKISCGYYIIEFMSQYLDDYVTEKATPLHSAKDLSFVAHSNIRARRSDVFNMLVQAYEEYAARSEVPSIVEDFNQSIRTGLPMFPYELSPYWTMANDWGITENSVARLEDGTEIDSAILHFMFNELEQTNEHFTFFDHKWFEESSSLKKGATKRAASMLKEKYAREFARFVKDKQFHCFLFEISRGTCDCLQAFWMLATFYIKDNASKLILCPLFECNPGNYNTLMITEENWLKEIFDSIEDFISLFVLDGKEISKCFLNYLSPIDNQK